MVVTDSIGAIDASTEVIVLKHRYLEVEGFSSV